MAEAPQVFADERHAWETKALGMPMRVEAAALQGTPVWFRLIGPWNRPRKSRGQEWGALHQALRGATTLVIIVFVADGIYLKCRVGSRRSPARLGAACLRAEHHGLALEVGALRGSHHGAQPYTQRVRLVAIPCSAVVALLHGPSSPMCDASGRQADRMARLFSGH